MALPATVLSKPCSQCPQQGPGWDIIIYCKFAIRHYSIDDVLVWVPPALEPDEKSGHAAKPPAHLSAYHSLLTTRALGNGEETVTITEFSNGNGSLAAPRKCAKKRAQDPGADYWKGGRFQLRQ